MLKAEGLLLRVILALSRRHTGEGLSEKTTSEAAAGLGTSPPPPPRPQLVGWTTLGNAFSLLVGVILLN